MEMTGGEAVASALEMLGVRHVFGIVSVHNLPIYDAIARRGTITPIGVRHEQAAAHAADGYARATGELGVVIASTGPGTTNTMTGLFEAGFASSPVLLDHRADRQQLSGQGQGLPARGRASAAHAVLAVPAGGDGAPHRGHRPGHHLRGRGHPRGPAQPGAVEIPIDQQYRRAEVVMPGLRTDTAYVPDADAVAKVAEALSAATRPVLWAGGGVVSSDAGPALVALAEHLGAPVVTTVEGRGSIPEDHPLCLGALTTSPPVEDIVSGADMVLAVGTRFQGNSTRNWSLSFGGTLAHLDADPAVIGRNYPTRPAGRRRRPHRPGAPARRDRPSQHRPRACGEGPVGGCGRRARTPAPGSARTTARSWTPSGAMLRASRSSSGTRPFRPTCGATGCCRSFSPGRPYARPPRRSAPACRWRSARRWAAGARPY